ncbi:hypothetical protein [Glycomyces tarimensis]
MAGSREIRKLVTRLLLLQLVPIVVLFAGAVFGDLATGRLASVTRWALAGVMVVAVLVLYAGLGQLMNRSVDDAVRRELLTEAHMKALYGNPATRSRIRRLMGPAVSRMAGGLRKFLTTGAWILLMVIAISGGADVVVPRLLAGGIVICLYVALLFALNALEALFSPDTSSLDIS